jgi:hypothetical protein
MSLWFEIKRAIRLKMIQRKQRNREMDELKAQLKVEEQIMKKQILMEEEKQKMLDRVEKFRTHEQRRKERKEQFMSGLKNMASKMGEAANNANQNQGGRSQGVSSAIDRVTDVFGGSSSMPSNPLSEFDSPRVVTRPAQNKRKVYIKKKTRSKKRKGRR